MVLKGKGTFTLSVLFDTNNTDVSLLLRSITCLECQTALGALSLWISNGATVEDVENFAIKECITLNLYPEDVCFGMVKLAGVSMKIFH